MNDGSRTTTALAELTELCSFGVRFHGSPSIARASEWIETSLADAGLSVIRERVELPGWDPGTAVTVRIIRPIVRVLPAWPLLWSGATDGLQRGIVEASGPQGLWGDSMVWRKFTIMRGDTIVAYLHGRDGGPAAPQPLPSGSDLSVAHFSIGRLDALQLSEWLADEKEIEAEVDLDSGPAAEAISDNLIVDIRGRGPGSVLLCAHYDTFFNTVGAYDNGSGTIALLMLARQWAVAPPSCSVRLVFFTAEEWHLGGSQAYVSNRTADELDAIDYVINIDGLGRGSFLELFSGPEHFEAQARQAVKAYSSDSRPELTFASRFPPTTGTDDAVFYRAGIPTVFMTFNDLHRLHQPDDQPNIGIAENIDWTIGLVEHLVVTLTPPERGHPVGLL